jgi:hypothetical protein
VKINTQNARTKARRLFFLKKRILESANKNKKRDAVRAKEYVRLSNAIPADGFILKTIKMEPWNRT